MRILLVEDNCIVQNVTLRMLNRLGHMCQTVSTGEAACAATVATKFQLILMDLDLPGIGGLEAAQFIRKRQSPQNPLWVIALTGWPCRSTEPYLGREINDHLTKPMRLEMLHQALERAEAYLGAAVAAAS
ncbi:response regulator [bacterium]|nr:response regulator [bacterium]